MIFRHYLISSWRNLLKYKVQNLIGVFGIAVGFICFSICCCAIRFTLDYDSQYPDADRMYKIRTESYSPVEEDITQKLKSHFGEVEKVTSYFMTRHSDVLIIREDSIKKEMSIGLTEADSSLIDFFSLELVAGSKDIATKRANSVVLFESKARAIGEPSLLIGSTIAKDTMYYQITGILKDLPPNTSLQAYNSSGFIFNQIEGKYQSDERERWGHWQTVLVMLHKGGDANEFQKRLAEANLKIDSSAPDRIIVLPINDMIRDSENILIMSCIFFVGLLVLLTALFNYVSFQTAQFYNRLKECAVRKVNGSNKLQLFWLFYTDIAVVFLLSSLLSLVLMEWLYPLVVQPFLTEFYMDDIPVSTLMGQMIEYTVIGLIMAMVLCIIPSNVIGRLSIQSAIFGISKKGRKAIGRNILLSIQMVILLAFLSSTLIVNQQVDKVRKNMFSILTIEEQENVITVANYYKQLIDKNEILTEKIAASPAVADITFTNSPLYSYAALLTLDIGLEGHEDESVRMYSVAPGFCEFFNAKMISGEFFTENSEPEAVVVDETFASLFPDNNPVGYTFEGNKIIGVVENIQMVKENQELVMQKRPVYYRKAVRDDSNSYMLYVKPVSGKKQEAIEHINKCVKEFLPEYYEPNVSDLKDDLLSNFRMEMMLSSITSVFFVISLFMGLLSIYSAVAINTEKRHREIAIRKINGATVMDIIRLFCKTYIRIWTIVCLLSFPLIYMVARMWISTFNQQISLFVCIGIFSGIYAVILILIILTVVLKVWRTAVINPAEAIKRE